MNRVAYDFLGMMHSNNLNAVFGIHAGESLQVDIASFITGLLNNYRALLLFNWLGDDRSLHSIPYQPALGIMTGALLPLGVAAWRARLARHPRDAHLWLLPLLILVMLLPMTLAVENLIPSITRTGGVMPGIFLLVSLPLVRLALAVARAFPRPLRQAVAVAICACVILASNMSNSRMVFDIWPPLNTHPPYSHIGKTVRGLVDSGTPINNIIIARPHHWAPANISIEAGDVWIKDSVGLHFVQLFPENGAFVDPLKEPPDPDYDLIFIYAVDYAEAALAVAEYYPQGGAQEIESYRPGDRYVVYRVLAKDYAAG